MGNFTFLKGARVMLCAMFAAFLVTTSSAQNVSVVGTTAGTTPVSYATLNAAFAQINAGTFKGAITVTITANTTEPITPTPLLLSGGTSSYTSISIKPSGDRIINSNASAATNRGVIELAGADNVTIDGDDPGTCGHSKSVYYCGNICYRRYCMYSLVFKLYNRC